DPHAAHAVRLAPPHGALEEILHLELAPDLVQRLLRATVLRAAGARGHPESANGREAASHLVRHAVGEVLVIRAPRVLEREHGDLAFAAVRGMLPGPEDPQRAANDSHHEDCRAY